MQMIDARAADEPRAPLNVMWPEKQPRSWRNQLWLPILVAFAMVGSFVTIATAIALSQPTHTCPKPDEVVQINGTIVCSNLCRKAMPLAKASCRSGKEAIISTG